MIAKKIAQKLGQANNNPLQGLAYLESEGADPDLEAFVDNLKMGVACTPSVEPASKIITIPTGRAKAIRLKYLGTV